MNTRKLTRSAAFEINSLNLIVSNDNYYFITSDNFILCYTP